VLQQLQQLDDRWFLRINHVLADSVASAVLPCLNHGAPYFLLLVAVLGWLAYRNSRRHVMILVVVIVGLVLGDAAIFNPLKHLFSRSRPAVHLHEARILASGATGGCSFPSSHTANAFLAATVLSYFFRRRAGTWFACASVIGISRIGVGVHYPSDVIGSALLGGLVGWVEIAMLRRVQSSLFEELTTGVAETRAPAGPAVLGAAGAWFSERRWPAGAALVFIQLVRLGWAAGTSLDVPPGCARLAWLAGQPGSLLGGVTRGWFAVFGSSPLSLWMIPWFLQSAWLAVLWYAGGRYPRNGTGGGVNAVARAWSLVLLGVILPLASQLSFFGSPAQVFDDAYWSVSLSLGTLIWLVLLGLPVWMIALARYRSHPRACGIAILGLILSVLFPSVPWLGTTVAASGAVLLLADWLVEVSSTWSATGRGISRLLLLGLIIYGLVAGVAVYNPRVLRKLDLSFLPRNSSQYAQTGWREWADRIRPRLKSRSGVCEVWADSPLSRDQLQYWLGKEYRVGSLTDLEGPDFAAKWDRAVRSPGAFYVREVYFNQINPRVIFVGRRDDWFPPAARKRMQEMDSTEIFRKGDPVRQLQLYFLSPG
jgi:undecaprenyl-diphosphatase